MATLDDTEVIMDEDIRDEETTESRVPYKSWRKKYRKMMVNFETAMRIHNEIFVDEQRIEETARRLREGNE